MPGANLGAQAGNGTLTATIVDAQGGAIAGATLTVTEQATNATRTITTDPTGCSASRPSRRGGTASKSRWKGSPH